VGRDKVLTRLWEIANMDPERTRNSMSAQVKALSMIVAIEGLIPDRRAAQKQPAPLQDHSSFYTAEWLRNQQNPETSAPQQPQAQAETAPEPQTAALPPDDLPGPRPDPTLDLSEAAFSIRPLNPSQTTSAVPRVPEADYFAPDTRVSFSIPKKSFGRRYR
jgi:hypothetical protein